MKLTLCEKNCHWKNRFMALARAVRGYRVSLDRRDLNKASEYKKKMFELLDRSGDE